MTWRCMSGTISTSRPVVSCLRLGWGLQVWGFGFRGCSLGVGGLNSRLRRVQAIYGDGWGMQVLRMP